MNIDLDQEEEKMNGGVYAAVLTPMREDLSCCHDELAHHCLDLMQRGCQGIVLLGTTGEGPSFSNTERIEILDKLTQNGVQAQKLIVSNGSSTLPETIALSKIAQKKGCPTMLVAPPPYFKNVSEEGVIAYYREILLKTTLPILLYHIPQFTGVPLSINIIHKLTQTFPGRILGVKESEDNPPFAKEMIKTFPNIKVFVGSEHRIIEIVQEGGSGAICGLANLYPELICSLYEQGKKEGGSNPRELNHIYDTLKGKAFIPAAKVIMSQKTGKDFWRNVRPPLTSLEGE